jgi:hypothetical protein
VNLEPLLRAHGVPAADVGSAADIAGAAYAYARDLGSEGSVTTLFPRLAPPS